MILKLANVKVGYFMLKFLDLGPKRSLTYPVKVLRSLRIRRIKDSLGNKSLNDLE